MEAAHMKYPAPPRHMLVTARFQAPLAMAGLIKADGSVLALTQIHALLLLNHWGPILLGETSDHAVKTGATVPKLTLKLFQYRMSAVWLQTPANLLYLNLQLPRLDASRAPKAVAQMSQSRLKNLNVISPLGATAVRI